MMLCVYLGGSVPIVSSVRVAINSCIVSSIVSNSALQAVRAWTAVCMLLSAMPCRCV